MISRRNQSFAQLVGCRHLAFIHQHAPFATMDVRSNVKLSKKHLVCRVGEARL
jgi:hypothetical protein